MEIKFDVYFKKNLGTLFKDNEVDLNGLPARTNLQLVLVDRLEINYKVGSKKYTDIVNITDATENLIQIPFKSDVVKVGLNEFEIVAYMKNGDVKTSQTYTYNIDEAIGEGQAPGNSGDVDLSKYATKDYVDNAISRIEFNDAELRGLIVSLTKRIEELEKGYTPPSEDDAVEAKSYCGQMAFKSVSNITLEDLEGLNNKVEVVKPITTYAHSGGTAYNKTVICAIPKTKGNITSVVDGAGVDITASYPISEKEINGTTYVISCNKVAQAYNNSTVVKFNIN